MLKKIKAEILAICLLLLIFAGVWFNSRAVAKIADDFACEIEADETTLEEIYPRFMEKERFIALTVSHDDLSRIEDALTEGIGAERAGDEKTAVAMRTKLVESLRHLARLTRINLDSVL